MDQITVEFRPIWQKIIMSSEILTKPINKLAMLMESNTETTKFETIQRSTKRNTTINTYKNLHIIVLAFGLGIIFFLIIFLLCKTIKFKNKICISKSCMRNV
jgi:hypothetical protein